MNPIVDNLEDTNNLVYQLPVVVVAVDVNNLDDIIHTYINSRIRK